MAGVSGCHLHKSLATGETWRTDSRIKACNCVLLQSAAYCGTVSGVAGEIRC